ncbi:MAG: hypothetical protein K0S92_478 [Desertimonas sp.]|nr:hypothetical protein [Desertimonas sp.]
MPMKRGLPGEERYWRLIYSLVSRRRAARRLFGRRRAWRPVYTTVFVLRLARKILGIGPELVSVEKLKPGQFVRVEAIDPRTVAKR